MYNNNLNLNITNFSAESVIAFLILISYRFFYLIPYTDTVEFIFRPYTYSAIAILFTLVVIISSKYIYLSSWFKFYIVEMLFTFICLTMYTIIEYPLQDIFSTINLGLVYVAPISAIVYFVCLKDLGPAIFFDKLNKLSVFWCFILLAQAFTFATTGHSILFFDSVNISLRDESMRMGIGAFGPISLLYDFYYLCTKKDGFKIYAVSFSILMVTLFLVDQTRAMEVIILICVCFVLIKKDTNVIKNISIFFALVALFMLFAQTDTFNTFLSSFSSGETEYSTVARIYAIGYYLQQFIDNPVFGTGLLGEARSGPYAYISHGPTMMAFYSDVGFIGLLGNIGVFAIIVFIVPLYRFFRITKKLKKKCSKTEIVLPEVLVLYLFLTSFTLILSSAGNMIVYSFYFGIFEYWNYKLEQLYNDESISLLEK